MISDLGLTPEEVDSIMRDISGQPSFEQPTGETLQPRTGQSGVMTPSASTVKTGAAPGASPVKSSDVSVPALGKRDERGTAPKSSTPSSAAPKSSSAGPVIVGATTGLIFGGPIGAAAGAGAMWLLDKALKK
jgi:hypothetical protein